MPHPSIKNTTFIHKKVFLPTTPNKVYDALMDSQKHTDFCDGAVAKISKDEGGEFTCYDDYINGRNIKLIKGKLIVQAWRATTWPKNMYSIVKYELSKNKSGTQIIFDHIGFPKKTGEDLATGWEDHYWKPMKKYFAK